MNMLSFLKNISPDDWYLKATDKWLVKDNLEKRRKEFDWVLDEGEDSHFLHHLHHLNQIKRAIENDNKSK